jgi:hypothetical protein
MYAKVNEGVVVKVLNTLPKAHTFLDGSKTGNFDIMPDHIHIAEKFYPLVEVKPSYDRRIEDLVVDSDVITSLKVTRTYVTQPKDIDILKSQVIRKIERRRDGLSNQSLFQFSNEVFVFSEEVASNVTELRSLVESGVPFPSPFSWTQEDGTEFPMNEATFISFGQTVGAYKLGLIGAAKTHIAAVNALTSALAVVDYDFSSGWGNYVPPEDPV